MGSAKRIERTPVGVDRDQLAGLDVADEVRADDVERGGLAREHPTAFGAAEHERPEAVRGRARRTRAPRPSARARTRRRGGAAPARARARGRGRRSGASSVVLACEQLADQLAVGGEHAGQHAELVRELLGVREVAVVAERRNRRRRPSGTPAARCATCSNRSWSSGRGRSRGDRRAARAGARRTPA